MDGETKSEEAITSTQLTNGSVALTGEKTIKLCAKETSPTKMAGTAISKCQPPDEGNDTACSRSSLVSPVEAEKDVLETVENCDILLKPHTSESMKSCGHSEGNQQDSLVMDGDTKEPVNLEGGNNLGKINDISGEISSTSGDHCQEEEGSANDTNAVDVKSGDTSSAVHGTDCKKPLATKNTMSGKKIEYKYKGNPPALDNSVSNDTVTDELVSAMEIETDECKKNENAKDLSDEVKQDGKEQQDILNKLDIQKDVGENAETLSREASVDHENSSCKEPDMKVGLDKDMASASLEIEEKLGETEDKTDSSANKDIETTARHGDSNSSNLPEEEKPSSASGTGQVAAGEDVSDKSVDAENGDKPSAGEPIAKERNPDGNDCSESGNLAEASSVPEPRKNSAEAANEVENESIVLREDGIQQNEREIQTKLKTGGISSVKSEKVANQKQSLEKKNISGKESGVLESREKSKKEKNIVDKPAGDKSNSEETLIETDANTSEKCNGQEISPNTTKRTDTGEEKSKPVNSDANCASQDSSVGKSDNKSPNSTVGVKGKQLAELEGDGEAEHHRDHTMLLCKTTEKSSDKEEVMTISCDTSDMTEATHCDKNKVEGVASKEANVTSPLPSNMSQPKREPRAKMTLSPNRVMGNPCHVSSPPTATTSFGASRNKLASARKTLVNLVSNKGWSSILRQTPKSDDPTQLPGVIPSPDNSSKNLNKDTDKSPSCGGSTRLTLVKGADGKRFFIKTPAESSLASAQPFGQVVKQMILVSNPSVVTLSKDVEAKTGIMSTPGKENSCSMTSTTHKAPVQKARKSAHQTARKAQIAAYESDNMNDGTRALNPFANMTIKVPDLENALGIKRKSLNKLDAKTLDKILLDNVQRAIKKQDAAMHKTPIPVSSVTNVSTILVGQSILRRKKRRRMGIYKLPDLKKKKKSKKSGMTAVNDGSANNAVMTSSAADDEDPAKSDIQKLIGQLKMKRRKRPKLWACGKVGRAQTKTKTTKTGGVGGNATTPRLLLAKQEKLDDPTMMVDSQKWSNSVTENLPLLMEVTEQSTPSGHNSDVVGNRRSRRKRKGIVDEDACSVTSTAGDSDVSSVSTGRAMKQRKVESEGGDIPVLLPACTLSDISTGGTDCLAAPPHISPQKTLGASAWSGVSNRVTPSDKMVYTHPLGSLPGHLEQKLKAISPQQANLPVPTSLLKFVSTPNGMTFPLSPAKPDDTSKYPVGHHRKAGHIVRGQSTRYASAEERDRDFIPLCCCKINGASFANLKQVIYCQALDSIDGKVVGCCNKVTNGQLVRSAVKIPFMAVCEQHRKRLLSHQCCPGCGHFCTQVSHFCTQVSHFCTQVSRFCTQVSRFCTQVSRFCTQVSRLCTQVSHLCTQVSRFCTQVSRFCTQVSHFCTQGKFYQCKKEGSNGVHHFHKQCQVFRDNKYYCPHCGAESHQVEVNLKLHDPTKLSLQMHPQRLSTVGPHARMGVLSPKSLPSIGAEDLGVSISVRTTSTNKEISTAGMPLGPSRTELENIVTMISNDKPKKLRASSKSLYAVSYAGEVEKVLAILLDGGDPNMQFEEFNKQTALHAAAIGGYLSVVHLLIQAGATPHVTDQNLCTAAICAAEFGQTAVVRYLIKAGAIADAKGQDGMTCLHLAAKCGSVDTVKYLVEMTDTDVNIKDDGGWTPLIWATESCHLAVVRYMLLVGADPNIRDNEENTGLHWAAYAGCVDVAELFLNAGCCLEAANEHGDRPLHIAARQDHYECIVLFLARGADSEARNNSNKSAISCCVDQNGQVWMALRVNKQLKGFAVQRLHQPEQLLHRDISMGREANPLPLVNGVDEENYPTDFQYLMAHAETSPMNINHVITSLQCCQCRDNCCSTFCICSRNSVKCWYDKEGRLLKDFNYMDPPLIFECNKACSCWANCRNRVIQLGITCRLQVFRTNGRGWGVRTLLNIPQGTFVCEYIGELISDTVADNREDDSYLFDLDNKESDTYCIDARCYGNVSRFINHLCEPNLLPVKVFVEHQDLRFPRMCFFATRDIKANEELGFDYGEKFWIIKWKHFTCTCGSTKCKYSAATIHQTIADYNQRMADENSILN
ncbi:Histone-lysine N-methyltransferase EHMT2 [Lamellibrachia satsuma]|nr:Histone-lysine N-methyltransferase EHMT2 [Lamellibrachia satsuma]